MAFAVVIVILLTHISTDLPETYGNQSFLIVISAGNDPGLEVKKCHQGSTTGPKGASLATKI